MKSAEGSRSLRRAQGSMTREGFAFLGFDRSCSSHSIALATGKGLWSGFGGCWRRGSIGLAGGEQSPGDAGELVGQGDGGLLGGLARQQLRQPRREQGVGADAPDHAACGDDQELAQIAIAGLGDGAQALLAAGRVLRWHEPDPGGELAAVLEAGRIAGRCEQRAGDDRTDLRDGGEAPAGLVARVPGGDLAIEPGDLRGGAAPLLDQRLQDRPDRRRNTLVLRGLEHLQQRGETAGALARDDTELAEMRPDRVAQPGALLDQHLPGAMQHQRGLLVGCLDRHQAHAGPRHRLAAGRRVRPGVLATPSPVGLHPRRRHQAHLMAQSDNLARPIMSRGARLQATTQPGSLAKNFSTSPRRNCRLSTSPPAASTPCTWKTCLAMSRPIVIILSMDGSLLVAFIQTTTLWHFDASEQGPSTTSWRDPLPRNTDDQRSALAPF